jgi:hypothetical protein
MNLAKCFAATEQKCLNRLFERPESLKDHFPYAQILESENVLVNRDGSLGVVYKIDLIEHEPCGEDAIVAAVNSLRSWFGLPENAVLQVLFEQMPISVRDSQFADVAAAYPDPHPVSKFLFEKRVELLQAAAEAQLERGPYERHGYLTIRWFPKGPAGAGLWSFFQEADTTLLREIEVSNAQILEFVQFLRGFERSSQISLTRVGGGEFLDILRRYFNPVSYYKREFAPLNHNLDLAEQIVYSPPVMTFAGIAREGVRSRTLSLKTSPNFAYPGGMAYFLGLPFPFRMCLNVSFPSRTKVKKFFDMKEFFLENTPTARARRQKEEVLDVQNRLVRDDRCLHVSFHFTIEGTTEDDLDAKTRDVLSVFHNELECEAIVENDIGAALALNSLPLFYSPTSDLSARRFIRMLRSDLTRFVPIFDSFRGLKRPLQLYLSRESNLVPFSLLENETSNHTVVLADSGSGKSSFVIDAVQAAKRMSPEPLVFVIDKKSSYVMLSEYYDADLTVFDRGGQMPFSPFRGVFDEEKVAFLTQLLISGVRLMSPSFEVESDHYGVLTKGIRLAYDRACREQGIVFADNELCARDKQTEVILSLDEIIAELAALSAIAEFEKLSEAIQALIQKLSPFYGDGIYARYFNSKTSATSERSKLFFIYDLDALDGDPVLQSLMTMAVVEEIRQTIKLHREEGRQGFVVLEELQMLGRGSAVGKQFVLDAAETFRKLGVWLISLTPRPQNYFETEVGQAMWGVADNFLFLQMSADNVDYVARHSSLLDPASLEIVKSLRTVRGSHADVFFTNKKKTRAGAFRFFQTPYDKWLAPTNAKAALEAKRRLKKHGADRWRALDELAREFPSGMA